MPLPIDYLSTFPVPDAVRPARLRQLLSPLGDDANALIEVSSRFEVDPYGPGREHVQMVMAVMPEAEVTSGGIPHAASDGVVAFSTPDINTQGGLAEYAPAVSGFDFIVASWGNGSFYSYDLSDKVWMALGLSPRAIGGDRQRMIYDDLRGPEFDVASGELATQHYYSSKHNVSWSMRNAYLRRYLWMRGMWGVRVFFYEALLPDSQGLRSLMNGQTHVFLKPQGCWFELDIREFEGAILIQVWAKVFAVAPELCQEQSADGLVWPGIEGPMTGDRADELGADIIVHIDDSFLTRYEQNGLFDTQPIRAHGQWFSSPGYLGQWHFT